MATTILILGAGASKKAGAPLMADFLDVAHELWKTGQVPEHEESFRAVFTGIAMLQRVHSKSDLDIQNLESVFASFEMAQTLKTFGTYNSEEISRLMGAMRVVIVKTIEKTMAYPRSGSTISAPEPYLALAALVKVLREEARPRHSVALMTFNYDLAADYALLLKQIPIDYALGPDSSDGGESIPMLKLHGSINWGWCEECNRIVPWMLRDYVSNMQWDVFPETTAIRMPLGSQLQSMRGHGHELQPDPVLVPPTWNKSEYRVQVASVWARAAKELSDAENIFILGYSLPRTDEFFRYLYALGTVGDVPLKRFWVFNPDVEVHGRFKALLGPGARQRFDARRDLFNEALAYLLNCFRSGSATR